MSDNKTINGDEVIARLNAMQNEADELIDVLTGDGDDCDAYDLIAPLYAIKDQVNQVAGSLLFRIYRASQKETTNE